ncbi:PLP-dependent aminotransferase family protein [Janthinobacterium lividum]|uniref:aminotransferase-like domain-containing protein n=1 Tax=Janthinobacterium lividum TaxID=29581 RepID=UPI0015958765|nr:PLP-dependent aminotransferase family protein [Janthinobacterium lividum]QKY05123.1 PLP-dependent aminotransferase family protein [Janthinobacterium lividum]
MPQSKSIQEESQASAWITPFVQHGGPRYLQIADMLERALSDGSLRPGDRLPPQRRLAALYQVDLTTVTRAYDEAKRRNLLEGHGARGTYVAAPKVELTQMLDLSMNIPPPPVGVDFGDLLKQGVAQVLMRTDSDLLMSYHLGGGGKSDRAAGAVWLAPMFGDVDAEHVVACPGAQAALAALILTLSRPGDSILTESAVYPGLRLAASQLNRKAIVVETDADGMLPEALEKACRKHQARLVYLNPTLQNPTAHTMPAARRLAITEVVQRCGMHIIEDDPYWLLASDAPPPLAHYAPAHVSYIATLSKCLAPGLRMAYTLIAEVQLRERFLQAMRSFSLMATPLTTALTTQWIHDGSAHALLAGIRSEADARQDVIRTILTGTSQPHSNGIHVWYSLPSYWTSRELAATARAQGVAVTASDAFYDNRPPNAIRISLGSIRDRARLANALKKLSLLLAHKPALPREFVI